MKNRKVGLELHAAVRLFISSCMPSFPNQPPRCFTTKDVTTPHRPTHTTTTETNSPEGYFAGSTSSIKCDKCAIGYSSVAGSSSCGHADSGYYKHPSGSGESLKCPANAVCLGANEMPMPVAWYWCNRGKVNYGGDIFLCPRAAACVGASTTTTESRRLESEGGIASEETGGCWTRSTYDDEDFHEKCDSDKLLCAPGSRGPLCGSCEDGYTYTAALSRCAPCESSDYTVPISVIGGVFLVGAVFLVAHKLGYELPTRVLKYPPFTVLKHVDRGKLKVAYSTYQVRTIP